MSRRSKTVVQCVSAGLLLAMAIPVASAGTIGRVEGKKLVKLYGLDKPSTAYLREHVAEIERTPLDGICVIVMTDEPKPGDSWRRDGNYLWFTSIPLQKGDFRRAVADLNQTRFQRLNFNFMHYAARGPANADWFDDAAWDRVIANTRVAGWVVRETPLVGITFDCEVSDGGMWNYGKRTVRGGPDFQTYCAKVRQRGRQWASALCAEAPEVVVCLSHGYWVASPKTDWWGSQGEAASKQALADQLYALYPAFLDGVLEGLGPKAKIADGCENTYPYMVYDTFMEFRRWARRESLKLTAVPELFRSRMTYAMATWPGFRSDQGGMWNPDQPEKNFFTPDRLSHALHNAMAASDEFSWIWSGRDLWWPMSVPPRKPGEKIGWGVLQLYPEVYRRAMADSRKPKDLSWRPIPPDTGQYPAPPKASLADKDYEVVQELPERWWFKTEPDNVLFQYAEVYSGWTNNARPNIDEARMGWRRLSIGDYWERQGVAYDGVAWYRIRVTPPESVQGRRLWLAFGGVADEAHVFVAPRGMPTRRLGGDKSGKPFTVDATGAFMPGRETLVAVRVINPHGPGGIWSNVQLVAKKGERPYVPKPGRYAVLDLDFAAAADKKVPDRSGYNNHAVLSHCRIVAAPGGGKAVRLDGQSSSMSMGAHPSLNPWNGRRSWELWYSPGAQVGVSPIVYHILLAKNATYGDGLYLAQNSRPARIVFLQAGADQSLQYPLGDPQAWYHIVGTYDGTAMKLYVNGKLIGKRNAPIPPTINSAPVRIGGGAIDTNRCAPGLVAGAALYNYALSEAEIASKHRALTAR